MTDWLSAHHLVRKATVQGARSGASSCCGTLLFFGAESGSERKESHA